MQHDFTGAPLCILLISLTPIIAHCICKNRPLSIERRSRDRCPDSRISLQSVLRIAVPEVKRAVTSRRREGTMDRMERDRIDGVDVRNVPIRTRGWCISVAFEAEIIVRRFFLDVLDCAAAFDAAYREATGVGEATNNPRLELQW